MATDANTQHDSSTDYDGVDDVPREVWVYRNGVQDLVVHTPAEEWPTLYKRAGRTDDPAEMAAHDGPVLVDGGIRRIVEADYVGYQAYHPFMGRCERYNDDDRVNAVLLAEVERVV